MTLFGFNITRAAAPEKHRSAPETPISQLSESSLSWLRGDDSPSRPLLSNAYQQVVWVHRAINVLAEQIANIPFVFANNGRGRKTLIASGPLTEFYAHPHPQIDRFQ